MHTPPSHYTDFTMKMYSPPNHLYWPITKCTLTCDTVEKTAHIIMSSMWHCCTLYTTSHQACDTVVQTIHTITSSMWHLYKLYTHHHVKHVTPLYKLYTQSHQAHGTVVQTAHTPSCQACDTCTICTHTIMSSLWHCCQTSDVFQSP